jgi:acyl transferase domain-containing protein/acyl carrier protein
VGGTNVHVVLEQAPAFRAAAPEENPGPVLLALSAAGPEALEEMARSLAGGLPPSGELADVAATLTSRRRLRHRLAVVASNREEAAARLAQANAPGRLQGLCPASGVSPALVFPGQGSQHPGMGRGLYQGEPIFRRLLDEACEILAGGPAAGLRGLILAEPGDQEAAARLAHTAMTQPALFTVEYATARLLLHYGLVPEALAGHSVGEYVAACLAGVMDFPEALALVAERGRLMGSAPTGAMLALALAEDEARSLVEAVGPGVCLAVVNGPRQCVAAGEETAVAELEARVAALGRPARRLAVSHAFHCHLMDPILEDFRAAVAKVDLRPPRIPMASNLSGGWLTAEQATDPDYWVRHLRGQVRFAANLALLLAEPDRVLLEAGPGQVLTRLALANGAEPSRALASQPHPANLDERSSLRLALAGLWLRGWEPDWKALSGERPRRRVPLPSYPFQRRRLWVDPAVASGTVRSVRQTGSLDDRPLARTSAPADMCAALGEVWREVFGLPAVTPDDDFLVLGGDSLLAVRLAARIKERLGRPVAVADIFTCRTVRALALSLNGGRSAAHASNCPASPVLVAPVTREEGVL